MFFGNSNAVAHDVNDFGDVTAKVVVIRSETVTQSILNPIAKIGM